MTNIDLHTHTTCSDGILTPGELIALAAKKGLSVVAITDHDTIDGLAAGEQAAAEFGIGFVPGIEVSVSHHSTLYNRKELHLLGLFIDRADTALSEAVALWIGSRRERNRQMLQKLADAGVPIDSERLSQLAGGAAAITRAHFARALVEAGYCDSVARAFDKYLKPGTPTFAPRRATSAAEAIAVIRGAGGLPILAHPLRYKIALNELEPLVRLLADDGLLGLECYYSGHTFHEQDRLIRLAKKYRLCISGGSDFHGDKASQPGGRGSHDSVALGTGYGRLYVPDSVYGELQRFKQSLPAADRSR